MIKTIGGLIILMMMMKYGELHYDKYATTYKSDLVEQAAMPLLMFSSV